MPVKKGTKKGSKTPTQRKASKAYIAKIVKNIELRNSETKEFIQHQTRTAFTAAAGVWAQLTDPFAIAQGLTSLTRVGDKVTPIKFSHQMVFSINQQAGTAVAEQLVYVHVRYLMIQQKTLSTDNQFGVNFLTALNSGTVYIGQSDVTDRLPTELLDRCIVLKDKRAILTPDNIPYWNSLTNVVNYGTNQKSRMFSVNRKLKPLIWNYSSVGAVAPDKNGAVYHFIRVNGAGLTPATNMTLEYTNRLLYKDL